MPSALRRKPHESIPYNIYDSKSLKELGRTTNV